MSNLKIEDLIQKDDGYYVTFETLMEKDFDFKKMVLRKPIELPYISPSVPDLPGRLYKVSSEEVYRILSGDS
jgi:hypothetical protein